MDAAIPSIGLERELPKDTSVIPSGMYCYTLISADFLGLGRLVTKKCPYWSKIEGRHPQEDGYCAYLEKGDWELDGGLLWDACKECGVNMDD